jgi:hypothetical protein
MTHLNGGEAPARANGLGSHRPDHSALKVEARRLVEGTTYSQQAIAEQLRISPSTISTWKRDGGWVRPEGAPQPPALDNAGRDLDVDGKRRERMVARLYGVFDRQLKDVESRAANAAGTTEEKDARTLGTLARTLGTLIALETGGERDEGAPADAPEPYDPDEIRARLAQRLRGWTEEGES